MRLVDICPLLLLTSFISLLSQYLTRFIFAWLISLPLSYPKTKVTIEIQVSMGWKAKCSNRTARNTHAHTRFFCAHRHNVRANKNTRNRQIDRQTWISSFCEKTNNNYQVDNVTSNEAINIILVPIRITSFVYSLFFYRHNINWMWERC